MDMFTADRVTEMIIISAIMAILNTPVNIGGIPLHKEQIGTCTVQDVKNVVIKSCYKTSIDANSIKDADVNPVNFPYVITNDGKIIAINISNGTLLYNYKLSVQPLIHKRKPASFGKLCNVSVDTDPKWVAASQCFSNFLKDNTLTKDKFTKILFNSKASYIDYTTINYQSFSFLILSSDRQDLRKISAIIDLDGKVAYIDGYINTSHIK